MTVFGFFLLLGAVFVFCLLVVLAIFSACAIAGIFMKDRVKAATELSGEPVPYWPAEAAGDLASTVMCKACSGCPDHAHVITCTCTGYCGTEGCEGPLPPRRSRPASAAWNGGDMEWLWSVQISEGEHE